MELLEILKINILIFPKLLNFLLHIYVLLIILLITFTLITYHLSFKNDAHHNCQSNKNKIRFINNRINNIINTHVYVVLIKLSIIFIVITYHLTFNNDIYHNCQNNENKAHFTLIRLKIESNILYSMKVILILNIRLCNDCVSAFLKNRTKDERIFLSFLV